MTPNCADVSNYSGPLTPAAAQALKSAGVELVLVQAVDPPAGFPAGVTRSQIEALLGAGLVVDAYVYLYFDLDVSDIQHKLSLLDGLPIRRIFLDVEDTAAKKYDAVVCAAKVQAALDLCDKQPVTGGDRTGIYTGQWFWQPSAYMDNLDTFKDRDLWDSNYDGIADAAVGFRPYGGWQRCAIKQFKGTSTLAGVPNVDLNALSARELAKLTTVTPQEEFVLIPDEYVTKFSLVDNHDITGLINSFEGVITTAREIAFAEGAAPGADAQAKIDQIKTVLGAA